MVNIVNQIATDVLMDYATLILVHVQQVVWLVFTGKIIITVKNVPQIVLHVTMISHVQVVLKGRTLRPIHLGPFLVKIVYRVVQAARITGHVQDVNKPNIIGVQPVRINVSTVPVTAT